ncbi:MAG: hypothetical protein B0W54_15040 [Cellvibrio sp. 79]|nr:MAG: hypothetical protein B0W54_15040 [Cellvibrio sp. 79]
MSDANVLTPINNRVQPDSVDGVSQRIFFHLKKRIDADYPDFTEPLRSDMSFDYIGLDSVSRVELVTDLANDFGIKLDPTAAYDFVTIGSLAEFVWSEISGTTLDLKKALGV